MSISFSYFFCSHVTQLLLTKRWRSLRNLGKLYIDEREPLTELRTKLRFQLEDALSKATKEAAAAAMRAAELAAKEAIAKAQADAEAALAVATRSSAGEGDIQKQCTECVCVCFFCWNVAVML